MASLKYYKWRIDENNVCGPVDVWTDRIDTVQFCNRFLCTICLDKLKIIVTT